MTPVFSKKRFIAAIGITIIVLLVVLSPFILSSATALNLLLSAVNSRMAGTVRIESWIVGWQQGILCQQVVYTGPENRLRISVPRLTSTQGLLEVVLAPKNLGLVIAEAPVVEIAASTQSAAPSPSTQTPSPDSYDIPLWNQLQVELQIRDGSLQLGQGGPETAVGFRGIKLDADLQGGVINYDLAFRTLREQGIVNASGSLNLPARQYGWLDTLIAETDVSASGLDVHDVFAFLAAHTSFPSAEGLLNADMHFKTVGLQELRISGTAECTGLKLAGGPLGADTPSFQKVYLAIDDGSWTEGGWSFSQLDFVGDTATFKGSAEFNGEGSKLKGEGSISLPVLFDQFPHLLALREAAYIESGRLDLAVDLVHKDAEGKIRLTAGLENLGGLYDSRRFSWPEPSSLILNGEIADRDFRLHALRLDAPFAHIDGKGNLQSFFLDATADFQEAFTEIGRLFKIGWDGAGRMDLSVKGGARELDDTTLAVDTDIRINDFTLNRRDELVVPLHQFSLVGSISVPGDLFWEQRGTLDMEVALSSWLGEIFLVLDGKKLTGSSFRGYYTTDSAFNLDSITGLLHVFKKMPAETSMAGDLQVQAAGYLENGAVEMREFNGGIGGFVLVHDKNVFEDQDLRLQIRQLYNDKVPSLIVRDLIVAADRGSFFRNGAGLNTLRYTDHGLYLHNLDFSSRQTGSLSLDALRIDDWRDPLAGLGGTLEGELALEKSGWVLQKVGLFPTEWSMKGSSRFSLSVDTVDGGGRDGEADIQLENLTVSHGPETVWTEKEVLVGAELKSGEAGSTDVRKLAIDSAALQLRATGTIGSPGTQEISVLGQLTPDLEKIGSILRSGFDLDIAMAGKQPEPFTLEYTGGAQDEERINKVVLDSALHAERVSLQGITFQEGSLPFSLRDGALHLDFSGLLAGGKAQVVADIDLMGQKPVIRVKEAGEVLTGVQMEKPLVSGLLSGIYPFFGLLADPAGRFSVRLDSLVWPFGADEMRDASFVAVFDVRDVRFQAKGLLPDLLNRFGLEENELAPLDNELYCLARVGRITCSPLSYDVGKAEITVSGSLGMDGTVDYLLELPVTRKLAGNEDSSSSQPQKIRVAVSGTTDRLLVDEEKIDSDLEALARHTVD